jgi:hypothetical protein
MQHSHHDTSKESQTEGGVHDRLRGLHVHGCDATFSAPPASQVVSDTSRRTRRSDLELHAHVCTMAWHGSRCNGSDHSVLLSSASRSTETSTGCLHAVLPRCKLLGSSQHELSRHTPCVRMLARSRKDTQVVDDGMHALAISRIVAFVSTSVKMWPSRE